MAVISPPSKIKVCEKNPLHSITAQNKKKKTLGKRRKRDLKKNRKKMAKKNKQKTNKQKTNKK